MGCAFLYKKIYTGLEKVGFPFPTLSSLRISSLLELIKHAL